MTSKLLLLALILPGLAVANPVSFNLLDEMSDSASLADYTEVAETLATSFKNDEKVLESFCRIADQMTPQQLKHFLTALEKAHLGSEECLKKSRALAEAYDREYADSFHANSLVEFFSSEGVASENAKTGKGYYSKREQVLPISDTPKKVETIVEWPVEAKSGPVFFTADLPKGYIALTFDDGPHPQNSLYIIETLNSYSVKATFFGVGKNILKYPEIVKLADNEGHSYGSHSYDHSNLPKSSHIKAINNVSDGRQSVKKVLNKDVPFFRFPYGNRNKKLQSFVKKEKMATFFWNIDTLDWKIKDPEKLYNHTVKLINQKQRGIILFHDIHSQTVTVVPQLIKNLKAAGYKFVVFTHESPSH